MPRRKTQEEVINEFIGVHGDIYDYSLVEYKNNATPVKIICKIHGTFAQTPEKHKTGQGCPKCGRGRTAVSKKITLEEFINEANKVHNNKYDYSDVAYKNTHDFINIKCEKHGAFKQKVYSHLQGHGCPKCATEASAKKRSIKIDEFLIKARLRHGDKYDYSLVKHIKNNCTKILIICKHCDTIFEQKVNNHLNGQGCPKCRLSKLESKTEIVLKNKGILFEAQKTFPWLKNKRNMHLDFYLADYNVAIECQGEQHYNSRGKGIFTEEKVEVIKQRDELKNKLCKAHNIQIYYIKYNDNIEESINKLINEAL